MINLLNITEMLFKMTESLPFAKVEPTELPEVISIKWRGKDLVLVDSDEIGKRWEVGPPVVCSSRAILCYAQSHL